MGWSDLIGRQLGRYTIGGELGRGGSSRVYRGTDQDGQQDVAIKVIFNDAEDRIGFVRRFEREVQAVAQLQHTNIVEVYSHGETADLVYLVMQCVSGGTLRQRCGRPVPLGEAAAAIVQMCMALQHAHENGIIHRDVKPSNMLMDAGDPRYILLTDFGIAKLQGMLGLTKSGTTVGTPEYMSPEQAEGKDIDQRTDVYALGCVLYELLAGRPPFVGSTSVSVLYQQVHVRPPHLRAFNSEVPREVGRIIEQALSKRPEERFGTAAVLAEALYPYAEGSLPPLADLQEYRRRGVSGPLARAFKSTGPLPPYALAPLTPIISASSTGSGTLPPPPVATPQWAPPVGSGELVEPAPENWQGLGAEGLDAIFPDDPEAQPSQDAHEQAIGTSPTIEEQPSLAALSESRPVPARSPNRSIPLPAFRLPSKTSQPISGPTGNGRLDMEVLMAQIEGQGGDSQPSDPVEVGGGYLPPPNTVSAATDVGVLETPPRGDLEQDIPEYDTDEMAVVPPLPPRQRPPSSPRRQGPPPLGRARSASPRRRPLLLAAVIAAVLCVLLIGGAIATASILGPGARSAGNKVVHSPTSTATPLPSPTVTPPPEPSATATINPQQILNQRAAAAFRSVILSTFADNSCSTGNATRQFNQGESVYVDLCTSGGPFSGPVSVTIRQGGAVEYIMMQQLYLSPGSSYYFFRYGLPSGTYDLVVTMPINGKVAIARDLPFTIG